MMRAHSGVTLVMLFGVIAVLATARPTQAQSHAACCICADWFVLDPEGAGFCRECCRLCGTCKDKYGDLAAAIERQKGKIRELGNAYKLFEDAYQAAYGNRDRERDEIWGYNENLGADGFYTGGSLANFFADVASMASCATPLGELTKMPVSTVIRGGGAAANTRWGFDALSQVAGIGTGVAGVVPGSINPNDIDPNNPNDPSANDTDELVRDAGTSGTVIGVGTTVYNWDWLGVSVPDAIRKAASQGALSEAKSLASANYGLTGDGAGAAALFRSRMAHNMANIDRGLANKMAAAKGIGIAANVLNYAASTYALVDDIRSWLEWDMEADMNKKEMDKIQDMIDEALRIKKCLECELEAQQQGDGGRPGAMIAPRESLPRALSILTDSDASIALAMLATDQEGPQPKRGDMESALRLLEWLLADLDDLNGEILTITAPPLMPFHDKADLMEEPILIASIRDAYPKVKNLEHGVHRVVERGRDVARVMGETLDIAELAAVRGIPADRGVKLDLPQDLNGIKRTFAVFAGDKPQNAVASAKGKHLDTLVLPDGVYDIYIEHNNAKRPMLVQRDVAVGQQRQVTLPLKSAIKLNTENGASSSEPSARGRFAVVPLGEPVSEAAAWVEPGSAVPMPDGLYDVYWKPASGGGQEYAHPIAQGVNLVGEVANLDVGRFAQIKLNTASWVPKRGEGGWWGVVSSGAPLGREALVKSTDGESVSVPRGVYDICWVQDELSQDHPVRLAQGVVAKPGETVTVAVDSGLSFTRPKWAELDAEYGWWGLAPSGSAGKGGAEIADAVLWKTRGEVIVAAPGRYDLYWLGGYDQRDRPMLARRAVEVRAGKLTPIDHAGGVQIEVAPWVKARDATYGSISAVVAGQPNEQWVNFTRTGNDLFLGAGSYDIYWTQDYDHRSTPILLAKNIAVTEVRAATIKAASGIQLTGAGWVPALDETYGWWGVVPAVAEGEAVPPGRIDAQRVNWSRKAEPLLVPPGAYDVYWAQDYDHLSTPLRIAANVAVGDGQLQTVKIDSGLLAKPKGGSAGGGALELDATYGWWGLASPGGKADKPLHWNKGGQGGGWAKPLIAPPGTYDLVWKKDYNAKPSVLKAGIVIPAATLMEVEVVAPPS